MDRPAIKYSEVLLTCPCMMFLRQAIFGGQILSESRHISGAEALTAFGPKKATYSQIENGTYLQTVITERTVYESPVGMFILHLQWFGGKRWYCTTTWRCLSVSRLEGSTHAAGCNPRFSPQKIYGAVSQRKVIGVGMSFFQILGSYHPDANVVFTTRTTLCASWSW